jgi:hypothetical protein
VWFSPSHRLRRAAAHITAGPGGGTGRRPHRRSRRHHQLRYATNNFVGQQLYPTGARCLVHQDLAQGLATAADVLRKNGKALVFWDCYRPHDVQVRMFETVPNPNRVARPGEFARSHESGRSVYVTLAVDRFADDNKISVVRFGKDDRKIDRMRPYLARQAATGRAGVAAIGVAQEFAPVFLANKKDTGSGVWFGFTKANLRVTCYYFPLWDDDFGPAFVKVCAYFPYPMKIWVNGTSGPSGRPPRPASASPSCPTISPRAAILWGCRRSATGSGPGTIGVFAEGWWSILPLPLPLPLPLTEHDRAAGYWLGVVDAAGGDLAHAGARCSPARSRVLRGSGNRQPRHRPPGADRADLPAGPAAGTPGGRSVQDQGRHLRHRGQRQRLLPALPHQAVLEGRARCASRP